MTGGIDEVKRLRSRLALRLFHGIFILTRGMTLGVRAACFDPEGRVFLVRHTYVPGWYLPGGGVERHETVRAALEKELREEGNLVMTSAPELFHVYYNSRVSKRDHVVLYRVEVEQTEPRLPDREIAEGRFFELDALPKETTTATLSRLRELRGEVPPTDLW
ncbi:MAG TPA: NUDIX domain-containing protein [Pseudorhizobium sp.]|jgi:ADP-ribose pyrophosphatase YjhB (NUDIX family)|nr:NUDIX domain-containing protein [Pseudorhizobium sp.]